MGQGQFEALRNSSSALKKEKSKVVSPCVNICALNDDGFCVGCYRDGNEIRQWNTLDDEKKRQILNSCQRRASLDHAYF